MGEPFRQVSPMESKTHYGHMHAIRQKNAAPPIHATNVMQPGFIGVGAAAHSRSAAVHAGRIAGSVPAVTTQFIKQSENADWMPMLPFPSTF